MIDKVGGRLGHVAAVARRADATALAGECHHERLAAACAPAAGESEAQQPALEIAAELVLDVSRHGPLPGFPPGEPALKVLRDDLMERRLVRTKGFDRLAREMKVSRGMVVRAYDYANQDEAAAAAREGRKPTRPPYRWSDEARKAKRKLPA